MINLTWNLFWFRVLFFISGASDWGVSALQDNNLDSSWIKYIYPFTPKSAQICQTSSSSNQKQHMLIL